MTASLFDPVTLGAIELKNRIVMAPMTRNRADAHGVPSDLAAQYYAQRATAGLIISEGTYPSPMGKGYVRTPGIHTPAQVEAWRKVTAAVHAAGGKIYCQLMHCGRISNPLFLPQAATPVAPSEVRPEGHMHTEDGLQPFVTPRALATEEIAEVVKEFKQATERAYAAGFDGVELHAASGYLPEQFLSTGTNLRTDHYGGSLENRLRFVIEVIEAMASVRGAATVGIKIAPEMGFNDIEDENPRETYEALVRALAPLGLGFLHVAQIRTPTDWPALLRPLFSGALIAGGGMDQKRGSELVANGTADAVAFGTLFISNPDLPERLRTDAALTPVDRSTFYTPGPKGYVDYPATLS